MFRFLIRLTIILVIVCFAVILLASRVLFPLVDTGGVIAFSRYGGEIFLFDVSQKREVQLTNFSNEEAELRQYANAPSFSPDGKQIAFILGQMSEDTICGPIHVMNSMGGNIRQLNERAVTLLPMSWSPDGQSIMFTGCGFSGDVFSVDVKSGTITQIESKGLQLAQFPVWAPDGKRIAYLNWSNPEGDIAIADLTTDQPPFIILDDRNNASPSWSPDGKQIVYFGGDETSGNLYIYDIETQTTRALTNDPTALNDSPVWSPVGNWIAFISGGYYGGDLHLIDVDGNNRTVLTDNARNPNWMP